MVLLSPILFTSTSECYRVRNIPLTWSELNVKRTTMIFFTTDFGKLIHPLSNLNLPVAPPPPSHARLDDNNNRPTSWLHLQIQIDLIFIFTLDVVKRIFHYFFSAIMYLFEATLQCHLKTCIYFFVPSTEIVFSLEALCLIL